MNLTTILVAALATSSGVDVQRDDHEWRPGAPAAGTGAGSGLALDGGRMAVAARGLPAIGLGGRAFVTGAAGGAPTVELTPPGGSPGDAFASDVDLSRDVVAVGAPWDADHGTGAGSVHLFDAATGAHLREVHADAPGPHQDFGRVIALDGDVLAVRGTRAVLLHDVATGEELRVIGEPFGGESGSLFGADLDMHRGRLAVGAVAGATGTGVVHVFDVETGQRITTVAPPGGEAGDVFGAAVALYGDALLVGAPGHGPKGAAFLFRLPEGAPLATFEPDADDPLHNVLYGNRVALTAHHAVVSAGHDHHAGPGSGAVYVHPRATPARAIRLQPHDATAGMRFGAACVAADGDRVAVGSPLDRTDAPSGGAVYGFTVAPPVTVGAVVCAGDGAQVPCPCGNESPLGSAEGCANARGAGARLVAIGSASIAADDLRLAYAQAPARAPGVFLVCTPGGVQTMHDGLLCTASPPVRLERTKADGSGAGVGASLLALHAANPGDARVYQLWYRDPSGASCGRGSNLSNAIRVDWQP